MADVITLLPESLANQIAAGEVIQRPSSVVKELIENAVDARPKEIKLIIKDSGKTLIQVIDDGVGMSETDARMSFERHATSKIKTTEELFAIKTKGFRGEALASIAAVAKVELKTKLEGEELGTLIKVEDSKVLKQEHCQTSKGSSFTVKHLFYNVPARRKFLKSDPVELKHILEEFIRVAMAHPDIGFLCYHNENIIYQLPIATQRQRIVLLFGKNTNEKIIPVDEQTDFTSITGYIGRPDFSKKTRGDQYFFVNQRYIRSNYLSHAVKSAYEELIPEKHYPFFVLFISIDHADVDINVHPAKQEVKFENERLIYNYVKVSVKHALGKYSITPSLDFDQNVNYGLGSEFSPSHGGNITAQKASKQEITAWKQQYESLVPPGSAQSDMEAFTISSKINQPDQLDLGFSQKEPLQIDKKFIISQIKSGLIILDQQSAHERILYEKQMEALQNAEVLIQKQLFPITVDLDHRQAAILSPIMPQFNQLGFDIDSFGQNSFIIRGIPAKMNEDTQIKELIEQFIESFTSNTDSSMDIDGKICASLARLRAIKRGTVIQSAEMQSLIDQLFACEMPYKSPTGRKCFIVMTHDEIEQKFR